jgi:HSP20 family protein
MVELALRSDSHGEKKFVVNEIEQGVGHVHWRIASRSHTWRPPTDVYVTKNVVIVRVDIAGMRDDQFSISLDDRHLSIRGNRPDASVQRAYHQMEIQFGEFATEVELHWAIDAEKVEAQYRDGFLEVILPIEKPRTIDIGE